eukprot:g4835.t1
MSVTDTNVSWRSFTEITSTSNFVALLRSVNDPGCQFLKGPSFFRPRQSNQEGSGDACRVSRELGLDLKQSETLVNMITSSPASTDDDVVTRAKKLYFKERLALLQTLRTIFEEDYKGSCLEITSVVNTIRSFQSSGLISSLLKELISQLKAYNENGLRSLKPLTAGAKEVECLVEILMYSFRKHPCLAGSLMELFQSILSSLSCFQSNLDLQIKLMLLPMLAFGFWQALENSRLAHGRPLQHNLQSEFIELDGFFSMLNYGEQYPLETTLQLTWQVFRRFYSITSSRNGSEAPGGVYVGKMEASLMPEWIRRILGVIQGHTLCKECLLMMMSALTCYNSTFQDQSHTFEFFGVLKEILQNDYHLCDRFFNCQSHWKLQKLFVQSKYWFCFSVYPLMTLLTALSFPEFAPRIPTLLSFDSFGMVVVLRESEFQDIDMDISSGRVMSTVRIYPSIGSQIVVLKDTPGRIWEPEGAPNWLITRIPQTRFVKWENYHFRTILMFMMHRLLALNGPQHSLEIRQEAILESMSIVDFLSAYFQCSKDAGRDWKLNIESGMLIEAIGQWMQPTLIRGQDLASLLYLLRELAGDSPYQVLVTIRQSPLFADRTESTKEWDVQRLLSFNNFEGKENQVLSVADALIGLLTELMRQGFHLVGTCNWIEKIWNELVPKLKLQSQNLRGEILLKLYISIIKSALCFFQSDNRVIQNKKQFLELLENGYCLEDCLIGILGLIPDGLNVIKELTALQLELITNTCQLLSSVLRDPDLQGDFLTRIVQFLQHKGYWKTRPPASVLVAYCMRAFQTSELLKQDSFCSAAAIEFLGAYLSRLESYGTRSKADPVFLSSLPMVENEVHPDFRRALVLESVYHGREANSVLIKSAIDLLITVANHESEFFNFLVYPSRMDPGANSNDNSLLDVLWTGLQSSEMLWSSNPELLLIILKGLRAVQKCKVKERTAWEAMIGQNDFNMYLMELLKLPMLEIIQNEVQTTPVNQHLSQKLSLDLRESWPNWNQLLVDSIKTPIINRESKRMLYVLANYACFEICKSMNSNELPVGSVPFMEAIWQSVHRILSESDVNCTQVVNYMIEITSSVITGHQLQRALLNPSAKFEFLINDVLPGSILLDLMVSCDAGKQMEETGGITGEQVLPRWLSVQFRSYRMLQEFLTGQYEAYLAFIPTRDRLLSSWRSLSRFCISSNSFEASLSREKLNEIVPEATRSLQQWLDEVTRDNSCDEKIVEERNVGSRCIYQMCVKWSLHFIVNLTELLLECAEMTTVLGPATTEPASSPSPSTLPRQDSQIDYSIFDFEAILHSMRGWFKIVDALKGQTEELENKVSIQTGCRTSLILLWILRKKLSEQLTSLEAEESFQWILRGILELMDPRRFGYEVANAAIGALIGFSEFSNQWSEEILQTFHLQIQIVPLMEYIKQNQNLLLDEFQSWCTNFFKALEFLWNQRPLRILFESDFVLQSLWQYCQFLFNPTGLIQLNQPYNEANEKSTAFDHWCVLLPLFGKILHLYLTPENIMLAQEPFYCGLLRLYDQISVLLSSSFPSYLTVEFGNEANPLTLACMERIEVNLSFALGSHDVFATRGVHCLQQYNVRRHEVFSFIWICDAILHRTSRTGFLCTPVSTEEIKLDKESLPFDVHTGWFKLCKIRPMKSSDQSEETLSKFTWLLSKKVYFCLNKGMEYLKVSSTSFGEEAGQGWKLSKDILLRLQSDCLTICQNLVDSIGAGTDAVLRMEVRDLSRCLTSIMNLSAEFLVGWDYTRRRRHSEQFHMQLDIMHQLQLLVE